MQLSRDEQDRGLRLTSNFKSCKMTNYDTGQENKDRTLQGKRIFPLEQRKLLVVEGRVLGLEVGLLSLIVFCCLGRCVLWTSHAICLTSHFYYKMKDLNQIPEGHTILWFCRDDL